MRNKNSRCLLRFEGRFSLSLLVELDLIFFVDAAALDGKRKCTVNVYLRHCLRLGIL